MTARPLRDIDLESVEAVTMPVRSAQQRRLASELDQRVAERTAELAKASDEMRGEIGERRQIKAHLLEIEAARHSSLLSADRAGAKLPGAKGISKQMLRGISSIGETSPVKAQLSSE